MPFDEKHSKYSNIVQYYNLKWKQKTFFCFQTFSILIF